MPKRKRDAKELMKVTFRISPTLYEKYKAKAYEMGIATAALMVITLDTYINALEITSQAKDMSRTLQNALKALEGEVNTKYQTDNENQLQGMLDAIEDE